MRLPSESVTTASTLTTLDCTAMATWGACDAGWPAFAGCCCPVGALGAAPGWGVGEGLGGPSCCSCWRARAVRMLVGRPKSAISATNRTMRVEVFVFNCRLLLLLLVSIWMPRGPVQDGRRFSPPGLVRARTIVLEKLGAARLPNAIRTHDSIFRRFVRDRNSESGGNKNGAPAHTSPACCVCRHARDHVRFCYAGGRAGHYHAAVRTGSAILRTGEFDAFADRGGSDRLAARIPAHQHHQSSGK